jgi:hypothetical protein
LKGDLDLKVDDTTAFVSDETMKAAVQEGLAETVGVAASKVVIKEIAVVKARRLEEAGLKRRLGAVAGSVKVKYEITDESKKIVPAAISAKGAEMQANTNNAIKKAGKKAAVTAPATMPAPKKVVEPKKVPATTTTAPADFYTVVETAVELEVTDTDLFQTEPLVVSSVAEAMADLLEVPHKQVELISIVVVPPVAGVVAVPKRRLGAKAPAGKVKAAMKIKDPKNKITPAKVAAAVPKLPTPANAKLVKKGVDAKIGKAKVATPPTVKKVPTDPCKIQVTPAPVAPVPGPCAPVVPGLPVPVNPCAPAPVAPAPVVPAPVPPALKYTAQKPLADRASTSNPVLMGALGLAVPLLIGMMVVAARSALRQGSSDASSYDTVELEMAGLD